MSTTVTNSELVNISEFLLTIQSDYKDDDSYMRSVLTCAKVLNARFAEQNIQDDEREEIVEDIRNG